MTEEQLFGLGLQLCLLLAIIVTAYQRRRVGPHPWVLLDSGHAIVAFVLGSSSSATLLGALEGTGTELDLRTTMTASALGGLIAFGIIWLRVPLRELGLRSAPARWIVASIGLVVPFMAFVWVYNALLEHAGVVYENQWVLDRAADQSGSASFWIAMMHGSLLVPFLEEALFRGSLQTAAIRRLGSCKGIGLTAITFGSMHMPDPYAVLPLVGLGVVLGWLRHRSNSLWPSVVLHATNNAVAFLVVGFEIL